MSLKVFVFGGVLLALDAMVRAFGGNIDPQLDKFVIIIGAIMTVLGGLFYVFDH